MGTWWIYNAAYSLAAAALLTSNAWANDLFEAPRPQDVPQLINALGDENLRTGAVVALGKVGTPAALPLAEAIKSSEGELRLWAVYALGKIGADAKAAVPVLTDLLQEKDATLRATTIEALGRIGPPAAGAVNQLADTLQASNLRERVWTARSLGQIGDAHAAPALVEALHDTHPNVQLAAKRALTQIGKPATGALTAALQQQSVRVQAALILREVNPAAAKNQGVDQWTSRDVPALIDVLGDTSHPPKWRATAARGLSDLQDHRAMPPLAKALQDSTTRDVGAEALSAFGKPAVSQLLSQLGHKDPAVAVAAAAALGQIGADAKSASAALLEALEHTEPSVRAAAAEALGKIGSVEGQVLESLEQRILANDSEKVRSDAVQAVAALAKSDKESAVVILLKAAKIQNFGVRRLAEDALKKIDPEAAKEAGID